MAPGYLGYQCFVGHGPNGERDTMRNSRKSLVFLGTYCRDDFARVGLDLPHEFNGFDLALLNP